MIEQLKVLVSEPVFDVAFAAGEEVVSDRDLVTFDHQPIDQV